MLRKLYDRVSSRLKHQYRFFRQGEMGRIQLLNNFMNTTNGVLFGADSFWEGVSIKGDQLRMVIIPRLPFRVPTDPVEQARHEHMQALGKNPFREYSLPQACLRFRQGFGRLIRTQTDRGAVVIMDSRINSMWYGKTFLRSLPELKLVKGNSEQVLQELRHFFASRSIINDTT
jgi:ATP-dependent DNA helicase DinG